MKNISTVFQNLVQLLVTLPQRHQHAAVRGAQLLSLHIIINNLMQNEAQGKGRARGGWEHTSGRHHWHNSQKQKPILDITSEAKLRL